MNLRDLTEEQLLEELRKANLVRSTEGTALTGSDSAQVQISAIERELQLRQDMGSLVKRYQQRHPAEK